MKITFDTNEDLDQLVEVQKLLSRIIQKQQGGSTASETSFVNPFADTTSSSSTTSSVSSDPAPSGMFSMFSDDDSSQSSTGSQNTPVSAPDPSLLRMPEQEAEEKPQNFRVEEY